ncbi:MAG: hypothetical protein KAI22_01370, partial [Gammaproteobacteria bacterium]|nr:hypothetical protein [Gammaproteobacteria bacterium]
MRIIFYLIYFIVFLAMAIVAMFLGGVSGVAGTFYLLVEPGDPETNLTQAISILLLIWLLVVFLRNHNKRVIKRNKVL